MHWQAHVHQVLVLPTVHRCALSSQSLGSHYLHHAQDCAMQHSCLSLL